MATNPPDFLTWAAQQSNLDPNLVRSVIQAESAGNPNAVSPKGAQGLMQLMPATAKELGVQNSFDPVDNVVGGLRYLQQNKQRFGTDEGMLGAYNAGPGRMARGGALPAETQAYIQKVEQGAQPKAPPDYLTWVAQQQQGDAPQEGPAPDSSSVGDYLSTLGSNILPSAGKFLENAGTALIHPIDTLKGIGKLGIGTAEKVLPDSVKQLVGDYTPQADAAGHYFGQRIMHPLNTLRDDPVGALADISMLTGAGEATLPGRVGEMAGRVSELTNPLNAVIKPAEALGGSGARALMGYSLKPSLKLKQDFEKAGGLKNMAQGALDEGILNSPGGYAKVGRNRAGIGVDKSGVESAAMAAGRTADPATIDAKMVELADAKGVGKQMFPQKDLDAVQSLVDEWRNQNMGPNPNNLMGPPVWNPITDLLDLEARKQGTYRSHANMFRKNLGEQPGTIEAEKAASLGAKQALEDATAGFTSPDGSTLAELNQRDARLNAIGQAIKARMQGGSPSVPLDALMGIFGGHAGLAGILGHQLLSRPLPSSLLAHGLNWVAKPGTSLAGSPVTAFLSKIGLPESLAQGAGKAAEIAQPNRFLTQKAVLMRALQGGQ